MGYIKLIKEFNRRLDCGSLIFLEEDYYGCCFKAQRTG